MLALSLQVLFASIASVASNPVVYDQRQTGETNVRVEVKDAVLIAVGDGEFGGDYDYTYDYSDLTIKPPSSTTSISSTTKATPTTTTARLNVTQNAAVLLEAENNSIIFPANKPGNVSAGVDTIKLPHKHDEIPVVVLQETHAVRPHKYLPVKTVNKHYVPSSRIRGKATNGTTITSEGLLPRHCSPGFFLDNHNRCKQIRRPIRERPQLPIGLRFDHRTASKS